jgi:CDP-diacylglycerol--glycerol-3-phosphate 3-phosphatidyltransferase
MADPKMANSTRTVIFTLPNLITMIRVGAVPVLVWLLYMPGSWPPWMAAALFFIAGISDFLDGWLARRMHWESTVGEFLDPVADKLLVSSMLIMLVITQRIPAWITVAIICREMIVTGMRLVAATKGFTVPSDMAGKSKTALQMTAIFLLLLPAPIWGMDTRFYGNVLLWMAVLITLWSGTAYYLRFKRRLKRAGG